MVANSLKFIYIFIQIIINYLIYISCFGNIHVLFFKKKKIIFSHKNNLYKIHLIIICVYMYLHL